MQRAHGDVALNAERIVLCTTYSGSPVIEYLAPGGRGWEVVHITWTDMDKATNMLFDMAQKHRTREEDEMKNTGQ